MLLSWVSPSSVTGYGHGRKNPGPQNKNTVLEQQQPLLGRVSRKCVVAQPVLRRGLSGKAAGRKAPATSGTGAALRLNVRSEWGKLGGSSLSCYR